MDLIKPIYVEATEMRNESLTRLVGGVVIGRGTDADRENESCDARSEILRGTVKWSEVF